MAPPSTTAMRSASTTVESRCAIMITVLPAARRPSACWMSASFSGSAKAVASSSTTTGASFRMARANAMRWHSPPDRYTPADPTTVERPSGDLAMMSAHWAASAAERTSSSLASGRPMRML